MIIFTGLRKTDTALELTGYAVIVVVHSMTTQGLGEYSPSCLDTWDSATELLLLHFFFFLVYTTWPSTINDMRPSCYFNTQRLSDFPIVPEYR